MKKFLSRLVLLLLLCASFSLASCAGGAQRGAKTTEELADRYLAAIMEENYEAVLSLLPEEVIEYGMKYLEGDREDVIDFVKYAAYDYFWLAKLPTHVDYTYSMTETSAAMGDMGGKESILLEEDGVKLYVQDAVVLELSINAGEAEPIEGSLFALKIENRWYLLSVAGDDELFVY